MLKRIAPSQLRLGMYVQEVPGTWINHPIWHGAFKLEKFEDLKRFSLIPQRVMTSLPITW